VTNLLIFLSLCAVMFQAGYQWRKWESPNDGSSKWGEPGRNVAPLDSLIDKI
jgi:hypothetical protein